MPSDSLLARFQADMMLERQWRWDGQHYERTSNAWLEKFDQHRHAVQSLLEKSMSPEMARIWIGRWRIFFMSCAELFGFEQGQQWWVSHYLFRPQTPAVRLTSGPEPVSAGQSL